MSDSQKAELQAGMGQHPASASLVAAEGGSWLITKEVVHILAMTTLAHGWAIPDKVTAL